MAVLIQIKVDKSFGPRFAQRLKRVPDGVVRGMNDWGQILRREILQSQREAGIQPYTGKLGGRGTQWRKATKERAGYLTTPGYGVALDSMKPHFVSVTQERYGLLNWALQARSNSINKRAQAVAAGKRLRFGLYVKPHPFKNRGLQRALPKLRPIVMAATRKALRNT